MHGGRGIIGEGIFPGGRGARWRDSHVLVCDISGVTIFQKHKAEAHFPTQQFDAGLRAHGNIRPPRLLRTQAIKGREITDDDIFRSRIGSKHLTRTPGEKQQSKTNSKCQDGGSTPAAPITGGVSAPGAVKNVCHRNLFIPVGCGLRFAWRGRRHRWHFRGPVP